MEPVAPEFAKAVEAGGYIGYLFFAVWAVIQLYNTLHKNRGENSAADFQQRQTELQQAFNETKNTIKDLRTEIGKLKNEIETLRKEADAKEAHCNESIRRLEVQCHGLAIQNKWMQAEMKAKGMTVIDVPDVQPPPEEE